MSTKATFKLCISSLAMMLAASTAHSANLSFGSSIAFAGDWIEVKDGAAPDFSDTVGVDVQDGDTATVIFTSGDITGVADFSSQDYSDFGFRDNGSTTLPNPLLLADPAWEANGFSFTPTSITVMDVSATGVLLEGDGLFKHASFDDTWGQWFFSGNSSSFSSGFAVNEPEMLSVFAVTLLMLGLRRRRMAKHKK